MAVYINGAGVISPQNTLGDIRMSDLKNPSLPQRFTCIEPEYSTFIDVKSIRRMSRIIKMGVTASILSLKEAGLEKPDAIIVGTALGCLEDTVSFLNKLVINKEEMLNPTAFIHSTHNTIASQIALNVKCMGYNSTYVHRNISFETALLDAMLLIEEKSVSNALIGGIDELTDVSFEILQRLGYYKKSEPESSEKLPTGSEAGEGSAFFCLSDNTCDTTYAEIKAVQTISFGTAVCVQEKAKKMLEDNNIDKVDLILSGASGQYGSTLQNLSLYSTVGNSNQVYQYKQLCGEYPTSSAFAMYLAARILKDDTIPELMELDYPKGKAPRQILIHNNFKDIHHSLLLLSAC